MRETTKLKHLFIILSLTVIQYIDYASEFKYLYYFKDEN